MKVFIDDFPDDDSEQKAEVEIHDYDIWHLDHTLALIILPSLKKFKEVNIHSHPGEFSDKETGGNGQGSKGWHKVLDKMILAFELMLDDESQFDKNKQIQIEKGLRLFAKYYQYLWV